MKKGWTEVALGEILSPRQETPSEDSLASGDVRVISKIKFASGKIEFRPTGETKTGMILVCPGDLVVSGINAAKGAIAIYSPNANANAAATIHYGAYEVNSKIADIKFIWWLLRSAEFRRILDHFLPGGIKTELKAKRLLPIPVPLPPLAEQQRIVAHLDAIEQRLKCIQKLREESEKELLAALRSTFHQIEADANWLEMGEVAPLVRRPIKIEPDSEYPELGARSFGKGIFHKPILIGFELTWQKLFEIQEGDIVFSNIKAWEGAIAVASKSDHGRVGSHRYLTCLADSTRALPEFICFYLLTSSGLEKVGRASPGSADRNRTLAVKRLEKITVPIPPLNKQKEFLKLLNLRKKIHEEHAKAITEQEALLSSLLDSIFNS